MDARRMNIECKSANGEPKQFEFAIAGGEEQNLTESDRQKLALSNLFSVFFSHTTKK